MAKEIRMVSNFEFDHPVLHFILVRPWVWIGKVWLQLLVRKHHLWAAFNPGFMARLTWFGPARSPLESRSAPILVLAGRAERRSRREAVGDFEPVTHKHD